MAVLLANRRVGDRRARRNRGRGGSTRSATSSGVGACARGDRWRSWRSSFRSAAAPDAAAAPWCTCILPNSAQREQRRHAPCPGLSRPLRVERRLDAVEALELGSARTARTSPLSFSTPTPCSPVTVPPTSMHSSRMRSPNAIGLRDLAVACWRRTGSADAGCRRRRGTRSRTAARTPATSAAICAQHVRAAPGAESCRRCSSNRARCGRPPETPPCGPTRTAGAAPRPSTRGSPSRPTRVSTRRISAISAATSSRRAVGLDQQHRRGIERIVGVHELLDRARRRLVHHLEARRE